MKTRKEKFKVELENKISKEVYYFVWKFDLPETRKALTDAIDKIWETHICEYPDIIVDEYKTTFFDSVENDKEDDKLLTVNFTLDGEKLETTISLVKKNYVNTKELIITNNEKFQTVTSNKNVE